jgi:hypothetical protein
VVTESAEPLETLGQRVDRQARQLISARTRLFGWLRPMRELLDHLASLPGSAGRFDRIEAVGSPIDFRERIMPAHITVDDDGDLVGSPLPSDIQTQLSRVTGYDASTMRVHHDRTADTVARAYRADAVTFGRDVYFRQSRFRPHEPAGFGLVAHEATHVAELMAPGAAWRRLTHGGRHDEEQLAEANERRALLDSRQPSGVTVPPQRRARPPTGTLSFAAITPQQSQPVASSRSVAPREAPTPAQPKPMLAADDRAAGTASALDVEALQRSLLQDLKRQLRSEFERGA